MKKYQNVLNTRTASTFVDIANRDMSEVVVGVKTSQMTRNGGMIALTAGSVTLNRPKVVISPTTSGEAFRVTESVSVRFNVAQFDAATLAALRLEVLRVLDVMQANLVGGVLPPVQETFVSGE